jgi:hypothetical protein
MIELTSSNVCGGDTDAPADTDKVLPRRLAEKARLAKPRGSCHEF